MLVDRELPILDLYFPDGFESMFQDGQVTQDVETIARDEKPKEDTTADYGAVGNVALALAVTGALLGANHLAGVIQNRLQRRR